MLQVEGLIQIFSKHRSDKICTISHHHSNTSLSRKVLFLKTQPSLGVPGTRDWGRNYLVIRHSKVFEKAMVQ